jgi:S-(hydroxymethyl)glutathione dehydrogenase / alcohol dehydrogenase
MKAAILVAQRVPLVVDDIRLPRALAVRQVLVKVHASGICGSQLGEIDGIKGPDNFLPHLLGHEGAGTVISVGPGVRNVEEGQKVVLHWRKSRGIEAQPPTYTWKDREVNAGWVTTFNEYSIASENRLTPIPDDSDMKIAALFGCAVTTGFGVVGNNARLKIGESVVIFGAGGIGLNIVQAAALTSANPIIAVDLHNGRLDLAKKVGATHAINADERDARTEIVNILGQDLLDVFIDNTGSPDAIQMGYELTHSQGRVVLVGVPRKGQNISIYSLPLHFGKQITGSHGGEAVPHIDIPRYYRLYREGRFNLKALVARTFTLEEVNEAIAGMRDGSISGRCIIRMQ